MKFEITDQERTLLMELLGQVNINVKQANGLETFKICQDLLKKLTQPEVEARTATAKS